MFDLLGRKEVDLTAALGWTLMRSPTLMARVWERLGLPGDSAEVFADLEVADSEGRTDLELIGTQATAIIEAKRGWLVPGETQLAAYAPRLADLSTRLLVSLSDSSEQWADLNLPDAVDGVAVRHLPWDGIRADLKTARAAARAPGERLWLDELTTYLAGATAVRHPSDQWTYCVVVNNERFGDRSTFREFVQRRRVYFHPYGGSSGWPKRPPTFIAFRWEGRIQQINRVTEYDVVTHLNDRFDDVPRENGAHDPHIVYELGPDIPFPTTRTQGIYATARVWALLDQILTTGDLKQAVEQSKLIDPT